MNTLAPISAWTSEDIEIHSPSRASSVFIRGASEIAMGAPTSGELVLPCGRIISACNPSLVWSDDELFLALPRWTDERFQRLALVRVRDGQFMQLPTEYKVLELRSFNGRIIEGVDSPIYNPKPLKLDVSKECAELSVRKSGFQ